MPSDNKTEQPTPRRRHKAREKGSVARSRDLISSLAGITVILLMASRAPHFTGEWSAFLRSSLDASATGDMANATPLLMSGGLAVLRSTGLALSLGWAVALVAALAQGGLVVAPAALAPSASRLSPAARVRQLFSLTAVRGLLKSLLPAAAILYVAVAILSRDRGRLLAASALSARQLLRLNFGHVFEMAWKASLVLLVWSGADYLLERQKLERDLRMSRQELLDEYKETEGNPATKSRIRRLQRQVRRRRMLDEVKQAAIVITNPTEFAVALKYQPEMAAPTVVAKGRNLLAQQIKQVARWYSIPVVENPPLAHALYRAVEVGQSIPPKLYTVVAHLLAAIYRAQERAQAAATGAR